MIHASEFLNKCKEYGFTLFTGTPCSYLKPFINYVIDTEEFEFIETTNEGDAIALASGAYVSGKKSVAMFQNSGLGNAVNALTSLNYTMEIPILGIVTLRGEPNGPKDEPQHELMGQITTRLLELMDIPWEYFPQVSSEINDVLGRASSYMEKNNRPYFLVMKKDSVEKYRLKNVDNNLSLTSQNNHIENYLKGKRIHTRYEAMKKIKENLGQNAIYIATTGKTGRELFEIEDSMNQFYMVGSMGHALPFALGIHKGIKKTPICVLDGDGALLMRMGNLALAGYLEPKNFIHILLDNSVHDSTGGQRTFSEKIDFSKVASACGYKNIFDIDDLNDLENVLEKSTKSGQLSFIRIIIKPGSLEQLGRPTVKPPAVTQRLMNFIREEEYATKH